MIRFLRRNTIAFVALCLAFVGVSAGAYAANTVRSSDIVDGQVKNPDLGNGAVTIQKTTGLYVMTIVASQATSACYAGPLQWQPCASALVKLPAGFYRVTVTSTVEGDPGNNTVQSQFCPAISGPSCIGTGPQYATFFPRGVTSSTWSGQYSVATSGGNYTFTTAVRFSSGLLTDASTQTRVDVYSTPLEQGNGSVIPPSTAHRARSVAHQ